MDELVKRYHVPRRMAYSFVEKVAVLPLLDGLDELDDAKRVSYVQAINYFAWVHGQLPMVVCSERTVEYTSQTLSVTLPCTVVIQNLTDEQILGYLALGGERMAALRERVESDRHVRKALCTPLMLRLALLTFAGRSREEIPEVDNPQDCGRQVLQSYATRMLEQPHDQASLQAAVPNDSYPPEDGVYYLSWLAAQMRHHHEKSSKHAASSWLAVYTRGEAGNVLLSHRAAPAVSSGLEGLTTVFGMGTGVSPPL